MPVRKDTKTFNGVALEADMPAVVGVATADRFTVPRNDGFQLQVTVYGEVAAVALLTQPEIRTLLTLNVTLAFTLVVAVI